eukprot:TRINITY_DN9603_c0_g1_i1.p1 TRINITY_DN9603_c0_g1~~TRINITY_DN9603_c0_g1_i1.p1  ORF type:complete len:285 (+),score=40.83 TRINITY_DN9603_c0_g1_i1:68-922(+)
MSRLMGKPRVSSLLIFLSVLLSLNALRPLDDLQNQVPASTCPVFYQTASDLGPEVKQSHTRTTNVANMMKAHNQISRFNVLYWTRDWDLIVCLFRELQLPVHAGHTEGEYARWATMLLALAWQQRFNKPCVTTLEDDIELPADFESKMLKVTLPLNEPRILKFGEWGEGYVFNLEATKKFVEQVYVHAVGKGNSDNFVNNMTFLEQVDVGIKKLVATNAGNIWESTKPTDLTGFANEGSGTEADVQRHASKFMEKARVAFRAESDLDFVNAARRVVALGQQQCR